MQGLVLCIFPFVIDFFRAFVKIFILFGKTIKTKLGGREGSLKKQGLPSITIIVPAYNEEDVIEGAVETLLEARYPKHKKQIIVIDDGSTDNTYARARPYAKRGQIKLFRRKVQSGSKASALNYGLLMAKNEIVIGIDADTRLDVSSLYEIVQPFQKDPSVTAVAGNIKVRNRKNLLTRCQAYEYSLSMEVGRRLQALFKRVLVVPGAFGAFKRRYLQSLGKYDTDTITEDFDVTLKILKLKKIDFAPKALAWTVTPESWKGWIRQRVRWARGEIETFWKHRDVFFKQYYGLSGLLLLPSMVFTDVILLFLRFFYMGFLFLSPFFYASLSFWGVLTFYGRLTLMLCGVYLFIEVLLYLATYPILEEQKELTNLFLIPFMILFYRPLHGIVRFKAYLDFLLGRERAW